MRTLFSMNSIPFFLDTLYLEWENFFQGQTMRIKIYLLLRGRFLETIKWNWHQLTEQRCQFHPPESNQFLFLWSYKKENFGALFIQLFMCVTEVVCLVCDDWLDKWFFENIFHFLLGINTNPFVFSPRIFLLKEYQITMQFTPRDFYEFLIQIDISTRCFQIVLSQL